MSTDDRLSFESAELRGLAEQHGARRVEFLPGVFAWQFPAWICPHCGRDQDVQPGCPEPLARHGPIDQPNETPAAGKATGIPMQEDREMVTPTHPIVGQS